jgi:hypothetical protein
MAEANVRHDSPEDETEVWNITKKPLRIPNHQIIMGNSSTRVRGWGIWKNDDIVKAWLLTGALTETDPGEEPVVPLSVPVSHASFPSAPNVFTDRVEPPRKRAAEKAQEPQKAQAGSSPGPRTPPAAPGPSPAGQRPTPPVPGATPKP